MELMENEYKDIRLKPIRKVIAKNMHASLHEMAQLTINRTFNANRIMDARKAFKKSEDTVTQKITINDMILYAVSRVLPRHPEMNAYFLDGFIRTFQVVNVGIAVDTPRGLLVPNIFHAESKSLQQISEEAKALITGAQTGNIDMEFLANGTFTVTNLGSMGIESFTPVNNPPQVGILGVCAVVNRMNDAGQMYPAMGLSLTFDHRAVDGAPAARFMKDLCDFLENFEF